MKSEIPALKSIKKMAEDLHELIPKLDSDDLKSQLPLASPPAHSEGVVNDMWDVPKSDSLPTGRSSTPSLGSREFLNLIKKLCYTRQVNGMHAKTLEELQEQLNYARIGALQVDLKINAPKITVSMNWKIGSFMVLLADLCMAVERQFVFIKDR
jgi:hypothetical protein